MEEHQIEKHCITIALENVGWLFKDSLTGKFTTWKGVEYSGDVIEIPWRNKKYWSTYSDDQYTKLAELIDYLCIQHNIIKEFIGNNIVVNKPNNYKGILNRSNYTKNYYDLSPAADFKKLNELEEWVSNKLGIEFKLEQSNSSKHFDSKLKLDNTFIKKYNEIYDIYDIPKVVKTLI
jgi:frataxin-like iron-binding protein CyaY